MASSNRPRARPAHAPGPTTVAYTPNGRHLITAGSNNLIRIFETGSDAEPKNVDVDFDSHLAVAATNDFLVVGCEDGGVRKYTFDTEQDELLVRCSLPVRDVALTPTGRWVAVASDDMTVKVVEVEDMTNIRVLQDFSNPPKHLSFDPDGKMLSVTCTDGIIHVFSFQDDEFTRVKKLDGYAKRLDSASPACSRAIWHPDGRAFAVPTALRDMPVISKQDWVQQRVFQGGHSTGDITAAAWSPNGALLVTAASDSSMALYNTKNQTLIKKFKDLRATVLKMVWHPTNNLLSYVNDEGELYMHTDFIPEEHAGLLEKELVPAPFTNIPLSETSGNARKFPQDDVKDLASHTRRRRDSLDQIMGDDGMSDFVEDDDGAGYAEELTNGYPRKRQLDEGPYPNAKRHQTVWQPRIHDSFQPGSSEWDDDRRYLCMSLLGIVWTHKQTNQNKVTVKFFDEGYANVPSIDDELRADKACLSEKGLLLAYPSDESLQRNALIRYRPHESWTSQKDSWIQLPKGEDLVAVSLSDHYIVAVTSEDYVRVWTLFGVAVKIWRHTSSPVVTCASWRDYVMVVGNGAVGPDGSSRLVYSIENVRNDETCQNEAIVALGPDTELKSVLWSEDGNPCVYDTNGVLLVLLHWRTPGQARWVPLLDTRQLERLASGRKEETYWPVAVARDQFHCIILKGGDTQPRIRPSGTPLLSAFDFRIPIADPPAADADGEGANEMTVPNLEESYVRDSVRLDLLDDALGNDSSKSNAAARDKQWKQGIERDKTLLKLLSLICKEGEASGMKALEVVTLLHDTSGQMLEGAAKIAIRFSQSVLAGKIRDLAERRLMGAAAEDEA